MFVTERRKSANHIYLEVLETRSGLSGKEKRDLKRYRSGYEGERDYDAVLEEVGHNRLYVFRDVWLGIRESKVQLDTLIVADDRLIVNEIKNYSGNYSYEDGVWKVRGHQISEDPVSQVSIAVNKLLKLRYDTGVHFEVQKEIVFVNPYMIFDHTDYKNPELFVMRNGLKQYFRSLHNNTSGHSAKGLAEEVARRIIKPPHPVSVNESAKVRFGVNCHKCSGFDIMIKRFCSECQACGCVEPFERLIVRAAIEFSVLFPGEKMTRRKIHEFLGGAINCQSVQRRLSRYFVKEGDGKQSHYLVPEHDLKKVLIEGGYDSSYEHDQDFIPERR